MSAYITHMLRQVLKKLPKKYTPVFSIMSPSRQIISIPNGRFASSFAWRSCREKVRSQKLLLLIMRGLLVYDEPAMLAP